MQSTVNFKLLSTFEQVEMVECWEHYVETSSLCATSLLSVKLVEVQDANWKAAELLTDATSNICTSFP